MPKLHAIHFNITKTCNLSCLFCYNNAVKQQTADINIKTIYELAEDAAMLGCKRIVLSGGEPLIRQDWQNIAMIFDKFNMEVSFATNGTLLNDEIVDFIRSLNRPTLSISIDGGEQMHNYLRGSKSAFQRTTAGIKKLKEFDINFLVNSVIYKDNLQEVGTLTKLARDFNCPVRLTLLHNNGRANNMNADVLTITEILRLREYCHILRKSGVNIFVNLPPLLQYIDDIIPNRGPGCGWAKNFCGILANGDVTICGVASDESELVAGNITKQRFIDIWRNSLLFSKTRTYDVNQLKGICGRCPFNDYCGGACRLSAYRNEKDFLAPYELCQNFYDSGYIPETILSIIDN